MRNEQEWEQKIRKQFIEENFTPRLQKDLIRITPPNLPQEIESLYIFGETDSGKTVLAAFLMLQELKTMYLTQSRQEESDKCVFISTPELIFNIRNSLGKSTVTELEVLNYYSNLHLLVLDDFGVVKSSDWVIQDLYLIINNRYENLKKTIFTSNLSLEELAVSLGDDRIPARIRRMGKVFRKGSYLQS